jgi:hypothetical protein
VEYATLAKAMDLLGKNANRPTMEKMECHKITSDWVKEKFTIPSPIPGLPEPKSFLGIPIYEVEHLAPGYMEAHFSDGSRKIIQAFKVDICKEK